jgi:hypothetical protein
MYDEVVASKKEHLVSSPGEWIAGLPDLTTSRNSIADEKPKWNIDFQSDRTTSGSEIIFNLPARTQRVSRRHVAVLDGLRALLREHGWETATPHPCDLVATKAERNERLLIEVKVVRSGDKALVAREAIGQLLDYSYSFKVQLGNHKLVGAFSEPIDDHYINLLSHLNISAWWFDPDEQSWKSRGATW